MQVFGKHSVKKLAFFEFFLKFFLIKTHTHNANTRIHTYTHTQKHADSHIHTYTHIRGYTHTHIHTYTHIHIYTYAHIHTYARQLEKKSHGLHNDTGKKYQVMKFAPCLRGGAAFPLKKAPPPLRRSLLPLFLVPPPTTQHLCVFYTTRLILNSIRGNVLAYKRGIG